MVAWGFAVWLCWHHLHSLLRPHSHAIFKHSFSQTATLGRMFHSTTWLYGAKDMANKSQQYRFTNATGTVLWSLKRMRFYSMHAEMTLTGPGFLQYVLIMPAIGYTTHCPLVLVAWDDDETVRVAVGLRLGLEICSPHCCPCGAHACSRGTHALSCKKSMGKMCRHQELNDVIHRALVNAQIPSIKEPTGTCKDRKRPDGRTLIPWSKGRNLAWDVTVADTLAPTYIRQTACIQGSAAEFLASKKRTKYEELTKTCIFVPVAFESMGPICEKTYHAVHCRARPSAYCPHHWL